MLGELGGGFKKKKIMDTNISTVITKRKSGWEQIEESKRGINDDGNRLEFGW